MAFLVARAENEPHWLRRQGEGFWRKHSAKFAGYRDIVFRRAIQDGEAAGVAVTVEDP